MGQRHNAAASDACEELPPQPRPEGGEDVPPPPSPVLSVSSDCACCSRGYKGASRKHALRLGVPQKPPLALALSAAFSVAKTEVSQPQISDVDSNPESDAENA